MTVSNWTGVGREDWLMALGRASLSAERRKGHEITIRWFLGWCRHQRPWAEPTREAARRFYLEKVRERNAAGWQKTGWAAALRWYVEWREADGARRESGNRSAGKESAARGPVRPERLTEIGKVAERPREATAAKDSWE